MENDSNLAKMFPADATHWRGIEIVSVWQAILLSLGIEPRTIYELSCERDPEDETDIMHYGRQEEEFRSRGAVFRNALAAMSLSLVKVNDPKYSDHVRLTDFVVWANGKGWSMPEWLSPRLRRAKTIAETSHGIGGKKKSGHFAPKPISLRLSPEKR